MKNRVARGLGYGILLWCAALAHAQLPGPLFELPLRKDPMIIPDVANVGFLNSEGEEVQYSLYRRSQFSEPARSARLDAANGQVLSSRRGNVRNADGFSFESARTLSGSICFNTCFYIGSETQAFDAQDRPLWRVYDFRFSTADLTANAFAQTLVANGVARAAADGARIVPDRNCTTHLALTNGNLLSCPDAPSTLRFSNLQGGLVWRVDGVSPFTLVLAPDGSRGAVLTTDGRVRVLNTASGRTQALSIPLGSAQQLLWANSERMYARTESDLIALFAAGVGIPVLWQRSFAELGVSAGWTGTDELGRIYLTSLSPITDVQQLSLDGNSARTALSNRNYVRAPGTGVHRFGRTLVEALETGELRGIDRETGVERWRSASITTALPQVTAASVLGDALYVASVVPESSGELELRLDQYDADGLPVRSDVAFRTVALPPSHVSQRLLAPAAAGSKVIVGAVQGYGSGARLTLVGYQQGRRLWQTTATGLCSNNEPLVIQANSDVVVVGMHPLQGKPYTHCHAQVFDAHTGASLRSGPLIALLPGTNNALRLNLYPAASDLVDVRTGAVVATLVNDLRGLHVDAVGKRIVAIRKEQNVPTVVSSLDFDGRVLASFSLPAWVSLSDTFALDGLLLLERYEAGSATPYTAAFDLNTGTERWRSPLTTALRLKWLKSGERWRFTSSTPIRQAGQRVSSVELNPLTGEVGYRNIGFSSAHSERTADRLVGELPGRIYFHSGTQTGDHGLLTGWAAPPNPNWARDARVDLYVRGLGTSMSADGRLQVRVRLANLGPDPAQDALLSVTTIDDHHALIVGACIASGTTCPPLGAPPPPTLDLPAGASMQIEFAFAAANGAAYQERLRVSLLPRVQDLDANLADNEYLYYLAALPNTIFSNAFED